MTRTLAALATAAVLALGTTVVTPKPAQAGCGFGCGVAIGVGTAALVGAATATGPYYGHSYYGPYAYGGGYGGCYWTNQRVWNGFGWEFHRVQVCN